MPKKVVIIGPAWPLRGGLASFNQRLARQFIAEGYDCSIYSFSLQYPSFLFPGTTQYSSDPAPEGLDIHPAINSINPLNWWITGRTLRRLKPDIIVVRYWLPFMGPALGTILRLVRKNNHTRVIAITDNVIPHEKRPGDLAFTRYFLRSCDAFVTMSDKVMDDLRQFEPAKAALQVRHPLYDNFGDPVGQQEARRHLQLPETARLVLFFGFIRPYKGLDLLLQAMPLVHQTMAGPPPARPSPAGSDPEPPGATSPETVASISTGIAEGTSPGPTVDTSARTVQGTPSGTYATPPAGTPAASPSRHSTTASAGSAAAPTTSVQVLVAGEFYEDRQPYDALISRLGIADKLILRTEFIPDSEVKFYLCAADVVVQPYRSATQSGVTPLAYHFEKPMIVTRVGSLPDLVPHEQVGLVAEPEPVSLAAAIDRYFQLGEKYFIPHLRREKEKYSWTNLTAAILKLANDIQK